MSFDLRNNIRRLVFLLMLITLLPLRALGSSSVLLRDYQVEILTNPDPPVAGRDVTITLKILHSGGRAPARGEKVFLSTKETAEDLKTKGVILKDNTEYEEASEVDAFGNYELKTRFPKPDTYYIKVAIRSFEDNTTDGALKAGFSLQVSPPDRSGYRLGFVLLALFITTVFGIYVIYVRRRIASSDSKEVNLLDIPWIKRLMRWKYTQPAFQIPFTFGLAILIILGLTDIQDPGKNLCSILLWTIWWAGIIFTFVLVGRLWCFMCPVGAITEWTSRIINASRLFPSKLRNVWLANFMFLLLTWSDIQVGVVRNPIVTGWLLIAITALAVAVGFLFQRRSFCRYLCPIGGLIGLYSMFSAVELRSKDLEVCRNHESKDCYWGNKRGHGCPMFETIPTMDSNNVCTFCGECIRSCPKDNIILRIRPFFKDGWTTRKRCLDEAALAIVLVGISIFVTGDMLVPWKGWIESAMKWVPAQQLGIEYEYTVELITKSTLYFSVSLILIPGMMLLTSAVSNSLVGEANHNGLKQTFITFGYMFIPIGLSMHLAHNAGHLLNESGEVIPAIQRVINHFTPFYTGEPNWRLAAQPLMDPNLLYWIRMGFFLIFYVYSIYAGYRLAMNSYRDSHTAFKALVPMILLSFVLMMVNVYLLNFPMVPRHGH
jgi:polyferredoxin